MTAQEVIATAANLTKDQIHQNLQTLFDECLEDYRKILNRLSTYQEFPEVKFAKQTTVAVNGSSKKTI